MDLTLMALLVLLFMSVALMVAVGARLLPSWVSSRPRTQAVPIASNGGLPGVAQRFEQQASEHLATFGARLHTRFDRFFPDRFRKDRWQDSALQRKFAQAGYRSYTAISLMVGAMALSALLGLVVGAAAAVSMGASLGGARSVALALLGLIIGLVVPGVMLEAMIRRRQREILEHFPDALDLIRICLEAGLGLDAAIQRVGQEFRRAAPALFDEFHMLSLELRAGAGRAQALQNLAHRTGLAEVRSWVTMILQSEKFGTGIAEAVRIHSDQLRTARRMNAEERAAKLSTKLLFPLVFCIFPALLLVLLGPAVITIQEQLGATMERTP